MPWPERHTSVGQHTGCVIVYDNEGLVNMMLFLVAEQRNPGEVSWREDFQKDLRGARPIETRRQGEGGAA